MLKTALSLQPLSSDMSEPLPPAGINDDKVHAEELAALLHACGGGYHVNLIPYNPVEGSEYKRPYRKAVRDLSQSSSHCPLEV
jgi:adenine C2-methylase RlmN of 23S rRNA A2503 and tRNA A37